MSLAQSDKDDVRQIVREETADMREEQFKQGALLEDLNGKFDTVTEMLSKNLNVKDQTDSHEKRITKLETDNKLTKSIVALHSTQLKGLAKD